MGKLFVCVGKKAQRPYRIEGDRLSIYTIEELCYYICKNPELLDKSFMREELADFVMEELGLSQLGTEMKQMIHFGGSLHSFCGLLLDRTGYLDKTAVGETERKIKANEQLPIVTRLKNQADYYRQKQEYYRAMGVYRDMLLRPEVMDSRELEGEIFFEMGTTLVALFHFQAAEECFARSLELADEPETRKKYLLCKRFQCSRKQYTEFVAENPDYYEAALAAEEAYERAMEQAEKQIEIADKRVELEELKQEFCRMTLE